MTGPLTFRRASQVGAHLANRVVSGQLAGGRGSAIGAMNLPPARGFKVVAGAPGFDKGGKLKHGGHVQFVVEPGDHPLAADGPKAFGHFATSRTPLATADDSSAPLLADGKGMPPGSLNIYAGSGLVPEPLIMESVSIDLGPLTPHEKLELEQLVATQEPVPYQRAGIEAHNCVTKVARGLSVIFDIPLEVEPRVMEMPVDYVERIAPAVILHAGRGELKKT